MHPASRALIRSQCIYVGHRLGGRHPAQRRVLSGTSYVQYGATLSFRLAHSVDPLHIPPSNTDFPINVIERQQSMHALSTLVEKGQLDEARQILADILDCGPFDGDVDVFRQIKDIIAPHRSDNPPIDLIMQLGAASSSRGYSTFARDELLPLVDKFGTVELHSQLERELENAETSRKLLQKPKDVFEDASEDYAAVLEQLKLTKVSTMDTILQQLPPLLPEPVANDSSIFEDEEQSNISQTSMDPLSHIDNTSIGLLDKLLRDGNLEQANQLFQQMSDLEVTVPLHQKYGTVALSILKTRDVISEDQTKQYMTWLSLIPTSNMSAYYQHTSRIIREIVDILLNANTPNIDVLLRTTVLVASKGYSRQACQAIPTVVPSIGPAGCRNFLQAYEKMESSFYSNAGMPTSALVSAKSNFRNAIIKALVFSNRSNEVIPLLKTDETFTISTATKTILRNATKALGPDSSLHKALEGLEIPADGTTKKFVRHREVNFGGDIVAGMRYLKRILAENAHAPHPLTIVKFMSMYLATGRTVGLRILADRAHRSNYLIVTQMILAEMLFYKRLGLHDQVIETFVEYFYLVNVPKETVLNRYKLSKARSNSHPSSHRRVINPNGGITRRKLWPETSHVNAVWEALCQMASREEIKSLYTQFVDTVRAHQGLEENFKQNKANDSVNLGTLSVKAQFDSSSFTNFIRPMMLSTSAKAGREIIRDMLELGITPKLHAYTELAGFYAKRGHVKRVFDLVHRLEAGGSFEYSTTEGKLCTFLLPRPDFPFYISILRGFLIQRNLEGARRMSVLVKRAYPYKRGESRIYDHALDDVKSLETLGSKWVYKRPYERAEPR